jgi:hypothetical protein
MLAAEYQTTVTAAWELSQKYPGRKGSNKLFLTLLGGGVFCNPASLFTGAICRCKDVIVKSGLQVNIVCYCQQEFMEVFPYVKDLMESTGGTVLSAFDKD